MSVIRYICESEIRLCSYTHISFLLFNIYISFPTHKIQCWNLNMLFWITATWLLRVSWVAQPTCTLNQFIGDILPFSASSNFCHALLFGTYMLSMKTLLLLSSISWDSGAGAGNAVFWQFAVCTQAVHLIFKLVWVVLASSLLACDSSSKLDLF